MAIYNALTKYRPLSEDYTMSPEEEEAAQLARIKAQAAKDFAAYDNRTPRQETNWNTPQMVAYAKWLKENPGSGAAEWTGTGAQGGPPSAPPAAPTPALPASPAKKQRTIFDPPDPNATYGDANSQNWTDYMFTFDSPLRGVQQALRDIGVVPTAANPFTAFMQKRMANAYPLFAMQNAVEGGGLTSGELRAWLAQAANSGMNMSPENGRDLLGRANAILRKFIQLSANGGKPEEQMSQPELALAKFMENQQNSAHLYSLASGIAPGLQEYLHAAARENLIPAWEAVAPNYAKQGRSWLDYALGSL